MVARAHSDPFLVQQLRHIVRVDPFYRERPEAKTVREIKAGLK